MRAPVLFFSIVLFQNAQAQTQEATWSKAMKLDSLGKHAQAAKVLDGLVEDPEWRYKALMARGDIYFFDLKRHEEAFVDIGNAMIDRPDSIGPYLNRSAMYMNMGMPDRSIADLELGLAHAGTAADSASLLLNTGSAYTMIRRFDEAMIALDRAIELDPTSWGARSNKATVLADLGRLEEAREIYLQLHRERPDEVAILNNLGFLALNTEDHEDAIKWFSMALALEKDDPVVMNNLGYAQFLAGDGNNALRNVQRSIELYPSNSYAFRNLGIILLDGGKAAEACTAFERALQLGFTEQYGPEVQQLRKSKCG